MDVIRQTTVVAAAMALLMAAVPAGALPALDAPAMGEPTTSAEAPVTAPDAAPAPTSPGLPTRTDVQAFDGSLDAVEQARTLIDASRSGSASTALRAILDSQGHAAEAPTAVPAPSTHLLTGAPPALAEPVARLVAAADRAEALRAEALAGLTPADVALVRAGLVDAGSDAPAAADPADDPGPSPTAADDPRTLSDVLVPHGRLPTPVAGAEQVADRVDQAKLRQAALLLVDTAEEVQPELAAAARTVGGTGPSSAPPSNCGVQGDVVYESDDCRVIVADTGPNTYPPGVDPDVLVDLGGDDLYRNGAARADLNVRVVVDVAGDDTYRQIDAVGGGADLEVTGQAFAVLGVALLWDGGVGADRYIVRAETSAPAPGPAAGGALATGQGAALAGAAMLVDGGGPDAFSLDAESDGGAASAVGQGAAVVGIGALLNLGALDGAERGGIDDAYSARATSTLHLVEDTGRTRTFTLGPADVLAQGGGLLAAVGALADAGGPDLYNSVARGAVASTRTQGAGEIGAGVLVDGAGDDTMFAVADGDARLELITTDPSFCWEVFVSVTVGETRAIAQGGADTGAGLLADGAGDDARQIEATSRATAIAEARSDNDCSVFGGNKATAEATSGSGTALGQGAGATGAGVLVDLVGADTNILLGESEALARAIATSPGPDVETADATAGPGTNRGQGHARIGLGVLADGLGDDRYNSVTLSSATEVTSGGASTTPGPVIQEVQGWGMVGAGWLWELAGTDAYFTVPAGASLASNEACWSNAPDGRGRDLEVPTNPLPAGCP